MIETCTSDSFKKYSHLHHQIRKGEAVLYWLWAKKMDYEHLQRFISTAFGKSVSVIKRLSSYEDVNLLVQESGTSLNYVCKILKDEDLIEKEQLITQQIKYVSQLQACGFKCSEFLLGLNGSFFQKYEYFVKHQHFCQVTLLYTFIHGIELEKSVSGIESSVMFELGMVLGHFHHALRDCSHGGLETNPDNPWDLSNICLLAHPEYLKYIQCQYKRERLKNMIDSIVMIFTSSKEKLRKGILHGDFHGYNIIVDESFNAQKRLSALRSSGVMVSCTSPCSSSETLTQYRAELLQTYGIIDFGDISYSYYVLEVGRLMGDLMCIALASLSKGHWKTMVDDKWTVDDAFGIGGKTASTDEGMRRVGSDQGNTELSPFEREFESKHLDYIVSLGGVALYGYSLINSISKDEISLLKASVLNSLLQYYILGTKSATDEPDNSSYTGLSCEEADRLIWHIEALSETTLCQMWEKTGAKYVKENQ